MGGERIGRATADVSAAANPVLVEHWRGDSVESMHRGAAIIASAGGEVVAAWGDVLRPVFPRSAIKMIQALPLLETGAADRFSLGDPQIALACASHSGECGHVLAVERWLTRIGIAANALECGPHPPYDQKAAHDLRAVQQLPTALHNNCSGKHAGFLTTALHAENPLRGYVEPSHPVQRRVTETLGEMVGVDLDRAPRGRDGCGIPAYAMPLRAIAHAMARLAAPDGLPHRRAQAVQRIVAAVLAQPWLMSGTGRFDARAMGLGAESRFVVKMGAEGVHVAIVPGLGLGVALKIDDGARRAAEVAMATMLRFLGLISASGYEELAPGPVLNNRGEKVGRLGPAASWALAGGPVVSALGS
jgi:L-asparaginase II